MPTANATLPAGIQIRNALKNYAANALFPRVAYSSDVEANASAYLADKRIAAQSVEVNEVSGQFDDSPTPKRGRDPWLFEMRLAFDSEVSLEEWEDALVASPVRVCPEGSRCRRVVLTDARYEHPARNSSGGTLVIYTLNARLG